MSTPDVTAPCDGERPLRRDAERNRRRILEAAGEGFAERGLGVTMDDIAERADVGVGTVYRRFPEKELLVEALFEDRVEELVSLDRKSTRLNSSHANISYAVFCLKKKKEQRHHTYAYG